MGKNNPLETDDEGWLGGKEASFNVGDSMIVSSTLLTLDSLIVVPETKRSELGLLDRDLALMSCFTP